MIAKMTNAKLPNIWTGEKHQLLLDILLSRGICHAPINIDQQVCEEVTDYFSRNSCYAAHVPVYSDGIPRPIADSEKVSNYGSYKLEQSLQAPYILESALDPNVLDLVGGYLGCTPSLYSINTFWTFPAAGIGLTHDFHRDEDDYRFVVLFIFWTDVEISEGEFYFIEKTHDFHAVDEQIKKRRWARRFFPVLRSIKNADDFRRLNGGNGYENSKCYERLFPKDTVCISGPPGTCTIADTFGIHRGSLPSTKPRLCTWIRYGLYKNDAYMIDKTEPVPASPFLKRLSDDAHTRYITRLVLDWDT